MLNSTLTLSRVGIILNMDADITDPLFKQGVDYDYKNFTTLFNTDHHEPLRQFLDKVFNSGKLQSTEFFNGANFYQLKCVITQPGQAICIITNNTSKRRPLSELEERNFKALVNTSSDWVWSFDTNFILITANPAFFDARRQASNAELRIGDNIFKNVQEETAKKWRPIYERALQGEVFSFEEKRNNKVRDYYVEIYLSPVYNDENKIIGCLGITRDITERKNAQFAIEGYTDKLEEFAFKTSHELRKPIANIIGMTNLLSSGSLDEGEKAKAIEYISSSINEVDAIVISMIELIDQYKKSDVNSIT